MQRLRDEGQSGEAGTVERRKDLRMSVGTLGVLLVAVALAAVGQLMLKHGMNIAQHHAKQSGRSLVVSAAASPWVLFGLVVFGCSAIAWLLTLSRTPLSIAYPFNALGYLVILIASVVVLHERASAWTWVGTAMVVGGLLVVVLTAPGS
jgi:drug/metabolite transporter (DMT)-like permease